METFADITVLMDVSIGILMIRTAMVGSIAATMERTTTPVSVKVVYLTKGKQGVNSKLRYRYLYTAVPSKTNTRRCK